MTEDVASVGADIQAQHRLARASHSPQGAAHARRAGELLIELRARLRDEAFFDCIKSGARLSMRKAQRYMTVAEAAGQADFARGYYETAMNGATINWRYWAGQMPTWTAGQAARLMRGLDPDVFTDLSARPNTTKKDDIENATNNAMKIERMAQAQGRLNDSPAGWLAWARAQGLALNGGFVHYVERGGLYPQNAMLPPRVPPRRVDDAGECPSETPASGAAAPGRVAWIMVLQENIRAIDAEAKGGKAKVMKVIRWLKDHGGERILSEGGRDEIVWLNDLRERQIVQKKTISNAISAARKAARLPG